VKGTSGDEWGRVGTWRPERRKGGTRARPYLFVSTFLTGVTDDTSKDLEKPWEASSTSTEEPSTG